MVSRNVVPACTAYRWRWGINCSDGCKSNEGTRWIEAPKSGLHEPGVEMRRQDVNAKTVMGKRIMLAMSSVRRQQARHSTRIDSRSSLLVNSFSAFISISRDAERRCPGPPNPNVLGRLAACSFVLDFDRLIPVSRHHHRETHRFWNQI